jgi:hypothetical protein
MFDAERAPGSPHVRFHPRALIRAPRVALNYYHAIFLPFATAERRRFPEIPCGQQFINEYVIPSRRIG